MINKTLSFNEILKKLYLSEWALDTIKILTYFFLIDDWIIFLFLLLPHIQIFGFFELLIFFITIIGLSAILIYFVGISYRDNNRRVLHTNLNINKITKNITEMNIFENDHEKKILANNFKSLIAINEIHDYKYCIIVMGSIIEFLLIRYCKINNIDPEPYTPPKGKEILANKKHFCNYIESAIKNDILGQKNSWYLIQNNLRNFRNYVHISKEIKEEEIDHDWYLATKGVFNRIIKNFKLTKEKSLHINS